jgi:dipeptidyl aminopeptidase/acylaminoacyl peptidase
MLRIINVALILIILSFNTIAKSPLIPLKHFTQMPMVSTPSISPDGKNIAVILNQGEFTQVAVIPFNDRSNIKVLLQLGTEKYRIDDIYWGNDERILVSVTQPFMISLNRYRTTHLYSANIDGSEVFEIRKKVRGRNKKARDFYYNNPYLLSLLENEPEHILVTMRDERDGNYSSIFKVNIINGDFDKYLPNSKRIISWGVTRKGEVLLAFGVDKDPTTDIYHIYTRKHSDADWNLIKTIEDYKSDSFSVEMYESETNSIIVKSDHTENEEDIAKDSLWRYHIATEKFELLGRAPENFDVTGAIIRREGEIRKVIGYSYNDGFIRYVYFDKKSNDLAKQIRSLFSKKDLQANLYDSDRNKERYIISTISDRKATQFYLFDKKTNKLSPWYGKYPQLDKYTLSKVEPFDFTARDGMKLHGYLTLPNNIKNPPVILYPHGGPYARDSQYFDTYVQMFASRGYAVLQVNFRGSTGYGNSYHTSGYMQWGKEMQTDLLDAMQWVNKSGKADTDNACIVGGSYGGYAALVAGFQTPDMFKCIISIAGISDMEKQINFWQRFGSDGYVDNAVSKDSAEMAKVSPVNHVSKFKAPVLLIHGKSDIRVSYYQSDKMYNELKDAGKDVEYELFNFGTHHLNDAANRTRAMTMMEAFLTKHLK